MSNSALWVRLNQDLKNSRIHLILLNLSFVTGKESYLQNTVYNTVPLVIHANGPTKLFLNTLGNYIPKSWNAEEGCLNCWEDMNNLEKKKASVHLQIIFTKFSETPTDQCILFIA